MEAEIFPKSTHQTYKYHGNLLHLTQRVALDSELSDDMADLKTKLSSIELAAPKDNTTMDPPTMHAPLPLSPTTPSPKRKSSADHYLTSPKRRSIEEIMRSQPISHNAPVSSIDAACKLVCSRKHHLWAYIYYIFIQFHRRTGTDQILCR